MSIYKVKIPDGGKSGALIVNGGLNFVVLSPNAALPEPPNYGTPRVEFRTLVPPGDTIFPIAAMAPKDRKNPWQADYADKIKAGVYKLIIFGFVEYEDDFSFFGYRKTGFCTRFIYYPPITDGWVGCDAPNYVYAK